VPDKDPRRSRESFNTVAELYARYRPGYPEAVVEDVVRSAEISPGSRVLEIGCGAGQLSVPLAERGAELQAVELGADLARIARRRLAPFPTAKVHVAAFESWPLPQEPFDAVVCANAFHWLDPDVRFAQAAAALRPGGRLAIVAPHHVRGDDPGFFRQTNRCYVRWGLGDDPEWLPPTAEELSPDYPEIADCPAFGSVERHRLEAVRRFTTESYIGMLRTDSLIIGMEPREREGFLADLSAVIDRSCGGEVLWHQVYGVLAAVRQ
jgi:SAM-dependent methyltransferase